MLPDHTVLARHGGCEVLAERHDVRWPDGSAIALHPVRMNGCDDLWRRAVRLDDGTLAVFDLRRACPPLRDDLAALMPRDHRGCVLHQFRLCFGGAAAVLARIGTCTDIAWLPAPGATTTASQAVPA